MKIYTIWAIEPSDPDGFPYLIQSWDEVCISDNPDGWKDELAKANSSYGGENVRILSVTIPSSDVRKLWSVQSVKASKTKQEVVE